MNGHDPYAYLKDVLTRLPTQRTREIGRLQPATTGGYRPEAGSDPIK